MIDFPDNPQIGQVFSAVNNTYTWDGVKWRAHTKESGGPSEGSLDAWAGDVVVSVQNKLEDGRNLLPCDGSVVDESKYPDLYDIAVENSPSYDIAFVTTYNNATIENTKQVLLAGQASAFTEALPLDVSWFVEVTCPHVAGTEFQHMLTQLALGDSDTSLTGGGNNIRYYNLYTNTSISASGNGSAARNSLTPFGSGTAGNGDINSDTVWAFSNNPSTGLIETFKDGVSYGSFESSVLTTEPVYIFVLKGDESSGRQVRFTINTQSPTWKDVSYGLPEAGKITPSYSHTGIDYKVVAENPGTPPYVPGP